MFRSGRLGLDDPVAAIAERGMRPAAEAFRHEALFYSGTADFLDQVTRFIRDGLRSDESTLVVVSATKIDLLRTELGDDARRVEFADMGRVGHNPARIIPAWRQFVAEQTPRGRRFRGIGEPISPDRGADELVECERHESLLNLAFADGPAWWLVCPYDLDSLDPAVMEEAHRNHPFVLGGGSSGESAVYRDLGEVAKPFDRALPEPVGRVSEIVFEAADLRAVRAFVSRHAAEAGLVPDRTTDLVFALNEVASNSVRHAGGRGQLRVWRDRVSLICEVRDGGRIDHPLVGRERPTPGQKAGFGLWLVNQLCDLVQVRSFPTGSVVRLHMTLAGTDGGLAS